MIFKVSAYSDNMLDLSELFEPTLTFTVYRISGMVLSSFGFTLTFKRFEWKRHRLPGMKTTTDGSKTHNLTQTAERNTERLQQQTADTHVGDDTDAFAWVSFPFLRIWCWFSSVSTSWYSLWSRWVAVHCPRLDAQGDPVQLVRQAAFSRGRSTFTRGRSMRGRRTRSVFAQFIVDAVEAVPLHDGRELLLL